MKKKDYILLGIILLIGLIFRLYKINAPLADLHSGRQANTAAVARNYAEDGFNLLYPKYDDLSNIQSGYENPEGYHFVEFPFYSATFAFLYRYIPLTSLEMYGRLTSIFFSLITLSIIYYLVLKEKDRLAAFVSGLTFAIFPFIVFFSRVVMPEMTSVAFMFISIWLLYLFLKKDYKRGISFILLLLSIFSYAISILIKPTTIFYSIVIGYLFVSTYKFDIVKKWQPYIFVIIGILPFILWRIHVSQYPEGVPVSALLIKSVNTYEGLKDIFFKPAFFRWMFMERLGILILGVYSSLFLVAGIAGKYKSLLLHTINASALAYVLTFQGGNIQHEYYQIIIFPMIAIMVGTGSSILIEVKNNFNKIMLYPMLITIFISSVLFSFYKVKDYYNYPADLPKIAKLINTFTQEDDLIVTDRVGDTTLLYLADRKGSSGVYKELDELKVLGYDYLVTQNHDYILMLKDQGFTVLIENEQFALIQL